MFFFFFALLSYSGRRAAPVPKQQNPHAQNLRSVSAPPENTSTMSLSVPRGHALRELTATDRTWMSNGIKDLVQL